MLRNKGQQKGKKRKKERKIQTLYLEIAVKNWGYFGKEKVLSNWEILSRASRNISVEEEETCEKFWGQKVDSPSTYKRLSNNTAVQE